MGSLKRNGQATVLEILTRGGTPDPVELRLAMAVDVEYEIRRCRRRMKAAPEDANAIDVLKSGYNPARTLSQTRKDQIDLLYPPTEGPPLDDDGFAAALGLEERLTETLVTEAVVTESVEMTQNVDGSSTATAKRTTAKRTTEKRPRPPQSTEKRPGGSTREREKVAKEQKTIIRLLTEGVPVTRIQLATGVSRPTIAKIRDTLQLDKKR